MAGAVRAGLLGTAAGAAPGGHGGVALTVVAAVAVAVAVMAEFAGRRRRGRR